MGYIVIAKLTPIAEKKKENLAITYQHVPPGSAEIKYAKVFFKQEFIDQPGLVEHEIGHALGFGHTGEPGHMMQRYQNRAGWGARALVR